MGKSSYQELIGWRHSPCESKVRGHIQAANILYFRHPHAPLNTHSLRMNDLKMLHYPTPTRSLQPFRQESHRIIVRLLLDLLLMRILRISPDGEPVHPVFTLLSAVPSELCGGRERTRQCRSL